MKTIGGVASEKSVGACFKLNPACIFLPLSFDGPTQRIFQSNISLNMAAVASVSHTVRLICSSRFCMFSPIKVMFMDITLIRL